MLQYNTIWQNPSVKYGLAGGIVTILLLSLFYFLDLHKSSSSYRIIFFTLVLFLNIGLTVWAGLEEKQNNAGKLPFQDGVFRVVLTFIIIIVIYNGFYYLLFNFIDPGLHETTKELTIEQMKKQLPEQGLNEEEIKKQIENVKNSEFTIFKTIFWTFIMALLSFVVALITAAFIKEES